MACDICGKTGCNLVPLNSDYQTDDIQQICSSCASLVNDHLWKLRTQSQKMNSIGLQLFMCTLKGTEMTGIKTTKTRKARAIKALLISAAIGIVIVAAFVALLLMPIFRAIGGIHG